MVLIDLIQMWRHRRQGHTQTESSVTPPMFDPGARGTLIRCSCGKVWAW